MFRTIGFRESFWPYRIVSPFFGHVRLASTWSRLAYSIPIATVCASTRILQLSTFPLASKDAPVYAKNSTLMLFALYGALIYAVFAFTVNVHAWLFAGQNRLESTIEALEKIDRDLFQSHGKRSESRKLIYSQLITLFCHFVHFALLVWKESQFLDANEFLASKCSKILAYVYPASVNTFSLHLFGNLVRALGGRYVAINEALSGDKNDVEVIRSLRILHRDLFYASKRLTSAFNVQLLLVVWVVVVNFIVNVYIVYRYQSSGCTRGNWMGILLSVTSDVGALFALIYASRACHEASRCANGTIRILDSLVDEVAIEELRCEISTFSHQLTHHRLSFSLCGAFCLDLEFVQSIIGMIATYLVIFIQLESVSSCVTKISA